jgi:hypothetical protein
MIKLQKIDRFVWPDIYRLPVAILLSILVARNYQLREQGKLPDEWYWADAQLLSWGYFVR